MLTTRQVKAIRNEYLRPDILRFSRDGGQITLKRSYVRSKSPDTDYVGRQMQRELDRVVARIAPGTKVSLASAAALENFGTVHFTVTFSFS